MCGGDLQIVQSERRVECKPTSSFICPMCNYLILCLIQTKCLMGEAVTQEELFKWTQTDINDILSEERKQVVSSYLTETGLQKWREVHWSWFFFQVLCRYKTKQDGGERVTITTITKTTHLYEDLCTEHRILDRQNDHKPTLPTGLFKHNKYKGKKQIQTLDAPWW